MCRGAKRFVHFFVLVSVSNMITMAGSGHPHRSKNDESEGTVYQEIFPNAYFDSVTLMRISTELGKLPGIRKVSVMMGTPANLALMAEQGLWTLGSQPG